MNIDFVIPWVDGNDKEWRNVKSKYCLNNPEYDDSVQRYRDWESLKYWFRGVEKFAPWVNKIHFITFGHLPVWLNTNHPKLNIVKHEDYIPKEYLPTFSSHTIELNIHRINSLSENFVYFNDDMFFINYVCKDNFFKNDFPRTIAALNVHCNNGDPIQSIAFNNVGIINEHFDFKKTLKCGFGKWFSPKYGSLLLRTLVLLFCPRFPGFYNSHICTSYKKSVFFDVWNENYEVLDATCKNRFRNKNDVNQWVMNDWQIASNNFFPQRKKIGKAFFLGNVKGQRNNYDEVCCHLLKRKTKIVCINDGEMSSKEFEEAKKAIIDAFEKILPEKSQFEL